MLACVKATSQQFTTTSHGRLQNVDTTVLAGGLISMFVMLEGQASHIIGIAHQEDHQVVLRVAGARLEVLSVAHVRSALANKKERDSFDLEHEILSRRNNLASTTFSTPNFYRARPALPRQACKFEQIHAQMCCYATLDGQKRHRQKRHCRL